MIAESALDPYAEHWGAWPDISFGFGQRIVLYHYVGDRTDSAENIAFVRAYVFAHPDEDIAHMAENLEADLGYVESADLSPVRGDRLLAALVVYNAGHYPLPTDTWWQRWAGNVANYTAALLAARTILGV